MRPIPLLILFTLLYCNVASANHPPETRVDVMHWWVSPGERNSINTIRHYLDEQGLVFHEQAVSGSGTDRFTNVLRQQVASGKPPMAAQAIGYDIRDWARSGELVNLDDIAEEQQWDEVIPFAIQHLSKYQNHWVATPINAHSTNWLWVNHEQFTRLGLTEPDTWADLITILDTAKSAGLIPIVIGHEAWEHTLLFELVAVGAGGPEFYRRTFIHLNPNAGDIEILHRIFERMSLLRKYLDPGMGERSWNEATDLIRTGKALLQAQGSWVNGEFSAHGLVPGQDFDCFRFPDTQGVMLLNSDQYIFFKNYPATPETREAVVKTLISIDLQRDLNIATGAAPARVDVPRAGFNQCGRKAINDMRATNMRRTIMGSIAMGNANPAPVKNALYEVISDHLMGRITNAQAVERVELILAESPRPTGTRQ
ncbi:ABC transporter substrate-binding protein [Marinobacter sp. F3R08]|uniref:ABC transporter substrate-binding protein n=1 Tax=Marinobacter sp. F3R08 TaxID=2841559 RepID=UPI001C09A4D2|nr:ABC transporter substrate-binding protein [Marinobacter sp. F3R08]MBU2954816.1 ABC transporter substrate-binding protein [Marinobacter sp. F3R08]